MVESIGEGSKLSILERTKDFASGEIARDYAGSICYDFFIDIAPPTEIIEEINDSELRTIALQSGSYNFWNEPCEDIYSIEDGEPV